MVCSPERVARGACGALRRWSTRVVVLGVVVGLADVSRAAPSEPPQDVGLFELDDASGSLAVVELERALHRELVARGLTERELASLSELRLTMGCEGLDVACLGRGGRAIRVRRMLVGAVRPVGADLEVHLEVIDVGAGRVKPERIVATTDLVRARELAANRVDAAAARLVDGVFPGTARPIEAVEPPPPAAMPGDADSLARPEPSPAPRSPKPPKWQRIGLGVSGALTGLFSVSAIALNLRLRFGLRERLLSAADSSRMDDNPQNDIGRGEADLCQVARESPDNDGKVRNAAVTRVCNVADAHERSLWASAAIAGVAAASTLVFGALMIHWKLRRPGATTWAPMLGPRGAHGIAVSGRF